MVNRRLGVTAGWASIVVAAAVVGAVVGPLPAVAGVIGALAIIRRRRRAVDAALAARRRSALPLTIDLIAVVIGAGGTVADAIRAVSIDGPAAVRAEFAAVLRRSASGLVLSDALVPVSDRLGPDYHPLIGALIVTEQGGAPAGALLQRLADDAEMARRRHTEYRARRLPVALLAPLVCCLLPAAVIGAVVPLVIVALRHLGV